MDERDRGRLSSADDNLAEVSTSLEMTKGGANFVEGELAINDRTNPPRFDCASSVSGRDVLPSSVSNRIVGIMFSFVSLGILFKLWQRGIHLIPRVGV